MSPDDFRLLGTLPGLYYIRDLINEQIETIEAKFRLVKPKRGRPKKIKSFQKEAKPESSSHSEQISKQMKKYWASLTPEQAAARRKKMGDGVRKAYKLKKKAQMEG